MSNGNLDVQAIAEKLDVILAFMMVRDLKGDVALIVSRLKAAGMSPKTMALVAGVTERAIYLRLSEIKKKRGAGKAGGKAKKKKPAAPAAASSSEDSGVGKPVEPAS